MSSADMLKSIILFISVAVTAHAIRFNSLQYRECAAKADSAFKAAAQDCAGKYKGKERSKCLSPHAKVKSKEINSCQQAEIKHREKIKKCQKSMPKEQIPDFKDCRAMKNKIEKNKCMNEKSAAFQKAIEECATKQQ